MGADITWLVVMEQAKLNEYEGEEMMEGTWYFRDSYNDSNLAWIKKLSYWGSDIKTLPEKKEFFEKMANITNMEIRQRTRDLQLRTILMQKRDDIKRHLKFIKSARDVSWSV